MCISVLNDKKSNCLSISFVMNLHKYISLVDKAYVNRGGIEGQREALKTRTGITIRKRMIADIKEGAVLPPIVIGSAQTDINFEDINEDTNIEKLLSSIESDQLSIIDGMQRTTALQHAYEQKEELGNSPVRIELWLAKDVNKLIYRMLVLNTGQVPWDMKRQLLTIYSSIAKKVNSSISDIELLGMDSHERRTKAGQFQGDKIIETFLVFSSGNTNVDLKDQVSQDFTRMNVTESTADDQFIETFMKVLQQLVTLDQAIFEISFQDVEPSWKIKAGKDIFTSIPAVIGFIGAASVYIYGEPGFRNYEPETVEKNTNKLVKNLNFFIQKLTKSENTDKGDPLGLMTLNEMLSRRSTKVGEFERNLYFKAFGSLFRNGDRVESLDQCWMSR